MSTISRRDLFKFGGVAAVGAAGASMLSACAPQGSAAGTAASANAGAAAEDGLPSFFAEPEPITDILETKDYDVVVVGAGAAGVPAALSAFEAGAKVALRQKESQAIAQGNSGSGIDLATSDPADIANLVSQLIADSQHRPNRELVELWAQNSGEAVKWVIEKSLEGGAQVIDQGNQQHMPLINKKGYDINFVTSFFGPKPYNTGNGMRDIADYAEQQGVDIFYSTPAAQLVQNDGGAVTGVVAEGKDGYIQFNASKGVIIATGDYENDDEMMAYYEAEMAHIYRKEQNKTGDGQKMMVWAGGRMEDVCGSKVLHDFDAGPGSMADMPFLCVKNDGTRFCNENRSEMATMGNFLKSEEDQGWYTQVFDSNYMTDCADWPGALIPPEAMVNYMPEVEGEKEGVYDTLINTYAADTIEELGEKLGLTDVAAFAKTVARYNELCALGVDEDMGKAAKWLKPIVTPPFYGIHRRIGLSTIIHGVNVNADMQVLDKDGAPIEGLYSIGNCAGNFFGSPDYPMTVPGLSLGRGPPQGYVGGRAVAGK